MSSKTLIAVVGPTAIGKTRLGIELAQHFGTEIISADSRQFFKEMQIGTAVPTPEELDTVTHHFIQHININEPYSVGDFERDAIAKLDSLYKSHKTVVMVGGSGLYVDAVIKGLDNFPQVDPELRIQLNKNLENLGLVSLQDELKKRDPNYYEQVDLENPHRVIRALEVSISAGKPYSSFLKQDKPIRNFKSVYVGINAEREVIYDRINQRVDLMMENGLLEEAKALYPFRNLNALQTVGYRELFAHMDGSFDLATAVEEIKKNTRRFAKRQLTWLRKNEQIIWVDYMDDLPTVLNQLQLN